MGELRDKCEVLEEEYAAVKKQLQTEQENQKFLGENGFGFGGSFLISERGSRDSGLVKRRDGAFGQDQDLAAVDELRAQGLDAELDSFVEDEEDGETPAGEDIEAQATAE